MIHLVNTGNNGPRCLEYRMCLITSISRFTIMRFKFTTCETRSIIALVTFKTCPSVDKLLGRLLMLLTSSSTLFMNSLMLSPVPGTRERDNLILAARTTPLSVSSIMLSSKSSPARIHYRTFLLLTIFEQVYDFPFILSYGNLEQIAVLISTIEINFHS